MHNKILDGVVDSEVLMWLHSLFLDFKLLGCILLERVDLKGR